MHSKHPQDWTVLEEWLAKILDETYEELREVEKSFIDNMSNRIVSRWPLSKAQQDWLEDIYARTS